MNARLSLPLCAPVALALSLFAAGSCSGVDPVLEAAARSGEARYEVDLDQARKAGWIKTEGDEALADLASTLVDRLEERLEQTAEIEAQADGTLAVRLDDSLTPERKVDALRFLDLAGVFEFRVVAYPSDLVDLREEDRRFEVWRDEHPELPFTAFNALSPEEGGSPANLTWMPDRPRDGEESVAVGLLARSAFPWSFSAFDLDEVYRTQDQLGYPAVGFSLKKERFADFRAFTSSIQNQQLAIVLDGTVLSAPTVDEPLPGGGIIRANFTELDVKNHFDSLTTGEGAAFLKRIVE